MSKKKAVDEDLQHTINCLTELLELAKNNKLYALVVGAYYRQKTGRLDRTVLVHADEADDLDAGVSSLVAEIGAFYADRRKSAPVRPARPSRKKASKKATKK